MTRTFQVDFSHERPDGKVHEVFSTGEIKSLTVEPGDIVSLHAGTYSKLDSWDQSGTPEKRIWFEPFGDGQVSFDFADSQPMTFTGEWLHWDADYQIRMTNRTGPTLKICGKKTRLSKMSFEDGGINKESLDFDPDTLKVQSSDFELFNLIFENIHGNCIYISNQNESGNLENGSVFFCEHNNVQGSGTQFNPHQSGNDSILRGFYRIGGNYYNNVGNSSFEKSAIAIVPQSGTDQLHGRIVGSGNLIEHCWDGLKVYDAQSAEVEFRRNIVRNCLNVGLFQSVSISDGPRTIWRDNDSYDNKINILQNPRGNSNDMLADNRQEPKLAWNKGTLTDMDWTRIIRPVPKPEPEIPEKDEVTKLKERIALYESKLNDIHDLSNIT